MLVDVPSNRIAWFRRAEGLTLRQLAFRLDPSGEGPTERTINRWERGESGVPDRWKLVLADVFGVSVPYLMGWDESDGDGNERSAA
jgi:transcriptional regulator with XRE-family HTH domain